jgi:hypothetical protein
MVSVGYKIKKAARILDGILFFISRQSLNRMAREKLSGKGDQ